MHPMQTRLPFCSKFWDHRLLLFRTSCDPMISQLNYVLWTSSLFSGDKWLQWGRRARHWGHFYLSTCQYVTTCPSSRRLYQRRMKENKTHLLWENSSCFKFLNSFVWFFSNLPIKTIIVMIKNHISPLKCKTNMTPKS